MQKQQIGFEENGKVLFEDNTWDYWAIFKNIGIPFVLINLLITDSFITHRLCYYSMKVNFFF